MQLFARGSTRVNCVNRRMNEIVPSPPWGPEVKHRRPSSIAVVAGTAARPLTVCAAASNESLCADESQTVLGQVMRNAEVG